MLDKINSLENVFFILGIIFAIKLLLRLLLNIKNGVYGFVLPRFFASTNFVEKYGKWAIVTGCTQGIGRYYAEELAKRGMSIVLISRSKQKLDNLENHISNTYGVATKIIVADFSNPEVLSIIVNKLDEFKIDIGVLVNNVGLLGGHHMPFLELDRNTVIDMINVNITAGTYLCHALLPKMKENRKGAVINISSTASLGYFPYLAEYSATKHYMTAFTRALSSEYSEFGITIQCIEPGQVATEMTKYFDKMNKSKDSLFEPPPDVYAKHAVLTLGYRDQTTGYWPHSFLMRFLMFGLVFGKDSISMSIIKMINKKIYKNALNEIQKKN